MSVTECNDELLDNFHKDNDIYGLKKSRQTESFKEVETETRRESQRVNSRDSEKRDLLGGYYDAKEDSNIQKYEKKTSENIFSQGHQKR